MASVDYNKHFNFNEILYKRSKVCSKVVHCALTGLEWPWQSLAWVTSVTKWKYLLQANHMIQVSLVLSFKSIDLAKISSENTDF